MRHLKRNALVLVVLGLIGFTMVACNTVEGAGRDIEAAGEGIEDAAD